MPKVKKPKGGWFIPKKKKIRRGPKIKPSEKGLPPCPSCGQWSMQKDTIRNEIFCGACGTISDPGNSNIAGLFQRIVAVMRIPARPFGP